MTLDWNDFYLVRSLAQNGSVSAAAKTLQIHQSTVFRRLNALEEQLNVRLFERRPTGYIPTPAGEEFCLVSDQMADNIVNLERRISGKDMQPSGTIRITAPYALFTQILAPHFAQFRLAYPEISLEVLLSQEIFNLTKRDADIAIRGINHPLETLVGRKVGSLSNAVYCSKQYFKTHPNLQNLNTHSWIELDEFNADAAQVRWLKQHVPERKCQYRFNNTLGVLAAVKEHSGLAFLPCAIIDQELDLVQVLPPIAELDRDIWILVHEDLRYVTRIRTFIDFIASLLAAPSQMS